MNTNRSDFPMRTLFLNKGLFYPYSKLDNGKYPWEDKIHTSNRIRDDLDRNGVVYGKNELLRVRFSREVANLIGGKKRAKTFLKEAFGIFQEQNSPSPFFVDIEMQAPQK
ncbi:hypothetical protein KBD33_02300 [Candidatus Gracilibacteria bacterium]|nr:hypothetical protein [Candidatus Gracilibacteria bacterium]